MPIDRSRRDGDARRLVLAPVTPALHFVDFRGGEYHSAVRIWGKPDFIHPAWDHWAQQDMHPVDTVIFARGSETEPSARFNFLVTDGLTSAA